MRGNWIKPVEDEIHPLYLASPTLEERPRRENEGQDHYRKELSNIPSRLNFRHRKELNRKSKNNNVLRNVRQPEPILEGP